ncbi:MAG: hypothetical protein LBV29_07910 [Azoarcus sp.]|jgi:hypothetical protein|nr:hypothetical protein [Azoarcus sp.]
MLRLNNRVKFSKAETDKLLTLGINLTDVRTQSDVNAEFARWASALARRRPDLLEKIGNELARVVKQMEGHAHEGGSLEPSCDAVS